VPEHAFFGLGPATDPRYLVLRDANNDRTREARHFIEQIWVECAPFLDHDFVQLAQRQFEARFWELYLAHTFCSEAEQLVPPTKRARRQGGPDLRLARDGAWIEAVIATPGIGPDAVPESVHGVASTVPDGELQLRLSQAIEEKKRKHDNYLAKGVVRAEDPFIVAVNTGSIEQALLETDLPRIVRVVFPFGNEQVSIDRSSGKLLEVSYAYEDSVQKRSGSSVATAVFLDPGYAGISAVLHAHLDEYNRPRATGGGFTLVHNPNAHARLPLGRFRLGTEYWKDGCELKYEQHTT
jgi:hypothetical protein